MANLITLGRIGLLFVGIFFIYTFGVIGKLLAFFLFIAVIIMDWLDGYVARINGVAGPGGAVIDILGDRIVENSLWIVYAHIGLIPVWVPIVVVIRGFLTDAVRSIAYAKGKTPFGEQTMMKSKVGKFLVASRFSRALYAGAKMVSFAYLSLYLAIAEGAGEYSWLSNMAVYKDTLYIIGLILVYATVVLCIIRALPVFYDGKELIQISLPAGRQIKR